MCVDGWESKNGQRRLSPSPSWKIMALNAVLSFGHLLVERLVDKKLRIMMGLANLFTVG